MQATIDGNSTHLSSTIMHAMQYFIYLRNMRRQTVFIYDHTMSVDLGVFIHMTILYVYMCEHFKTKYGLKDHLRFEL